MELAVQLHLMMDQQLQEALVLQLVQAQQHQQQQLLPPAQQVQVVAAVVLRPLQVLLPVPLVLLVQVLAALLDLLDPLVEDTTVEDINPNQEYINLDITKDGLELIYKSVCVHLDKWSGGDANEQVALGHLKNNLFRILLERQFPPKNPMD